MVRAGWQRRAAMAFGALALGTGVLASWPAALDAQTRFEVFLFAVDATGQPVTDLQPADIEIMEDEQRGRVVSIQRFSWPTRVTVLVDNGGPDSGTRMHHFRTSLAKFFEALPSDIEVSLIATAPQPRWLIKPTADRVLIQKGVNLITPDDDSVGRFGDSLIEYTNRLDVDLGRTATEGLPEYLPVLVSIGSTGVDGSQLMRDPLIRMIQSLQRHRVWTNFMMFSHGGIGNLNDGATVLIAKAAQEATKGRYEAIAASATSSLNRLLPDVAQQIAVRHIKQTHQYRVVLERPETATGALKNLQLSVARQGVKYQVTLDGSIP